jgi:hypothetical protein
MKPLTKTQVEDLPKGLTPAETPGRKFFRDMKYNRIKIVHDPITQRSSIIKTFCMNCRKMTPARIAFKALKFGRLSKSHGKTA